MHELPTLTKMTTSFGPTANTASVRFLGLSRWFSIAVVLAVSFWLSESCGFSGELKTKNVILVMTDGLRWQEVFEGAEEGLLTEAEGGVLHVGKTRTAYWRDNRDERRRVLMPFFWDVVAKNGQLYGNRLEGSSATVTNGMKFSFPGYNEMLVGVDDAQIKSNARKPNRNVTVFEWLHHKPGFKDRVAAFSSWSAVPSVFNRARCGFPVMGGREKLPVEHPNARQELLNNLIFETSDALPNGLYDSFTYHAAREQILTQEPRLLFVGFLETDAWAHAGRYDHVLHSVHAVDGYVKKLWETVQSIDHYRDNTTFIITTDHGRGSGRHAWKDHDQTVEGSEDIWMAFLGPDTPALGEQTNCKPVFLNQIAATLAKFLGEDYRHDVPQAGEPIQAVFAD